MPNTYDQVLYPSKAFQDTHPDRLATVATLHGLEPPTGDCRVLEVGCGDGSNLIPLAVALPHCHFTGIDLAARPIEIGQATIARLGLANIELHAANILDFPAPAAPFDYILAHGFCSWVPPFVLDAFFTLCQRHLSPHGVVYTSYNTYPQGHLREATRRILRHANSPTVAGAKEYLATVRRQATDPVWTTILDAETQRLNDRDESVTYHDELGETYHCFYVADFLDRAAAFGLQFLSEAKPAALLRPAFSREALAQPDEIAYQQALDLATFRGFRRTLLCRAELPIERGNFTRHVPKLRLASPLRFVSRSAQGGETFRNEPGPGQVELNHPQLLAILHRLEQIWPQAEPLSALLSEPADPVVLDQLLALAAVSLVHLRRFALPVAYQPGPRPLASPLARLQAASRPQLTTLLHTQVQFTEASAREFLVRLDGTCPVAGLGVNPEVLATLYRMGLMLA
ncbi:MAG: methyltransferase domain-containing protein [Acidobacteria bacterium]|jgi:SAM-dependent methyltransferase|nr:methyltransferase domain-containing protein [Acidobacteriota bacterium]